jgi:hypothetical protein
MHKGVKRRQAHSYLLRIWEERDESPAEVRYCFSLVDPYTRERYSFESLAQLIAFLEDWQRAHMGGGPPA